MSVPRALEHFNGSVNLLLKREESVLLFTPLSIQLACNFRYYRGSNEKINAKYIFRVHGFHQGGLVYSLIFCAKNFNKVVFDSRWQYHVEVEIVQKVHKVKKNYPIPLHRITNIYYYSTKLNREAILLCFRAGTMQFIKNRFTFFFGINRFGDFYATAEKEYKRTSVKKSL